MVKILAVVEQLVKNSEKKIIEDSKVYNYADGEELIIIKG